MKIKNGLIFCLIFLVTLAHAQEDGLDTNSFGQEPTLDGQELNEVQTEGTEAGSDEITSGEVIENPEGNTELGIESNGSGSQIDPTDSQGQMETPAELSEKIKNMPPSGLTTEQDFFPAFIYDERGRKDPFAPRLKVREKVIGVTEQDIMAEADKIKEGLSKFEVSALTLTAILIGKQSRPKALIKDPAGAVYVVHENDIIGRNNGVIKKIRQGQVVIVEYRDKEGERLYTTQVLSLGK